MDLARFEAEAAALIGARLALVSSDAPSAAEMAGAPLRTSTAA